MWRRALAAAAVVLVAACALGPRLEAPRVSVASVRLDGFSGAAARFTVIVTLDNPNDRELAVDAIVAEVKLEDIAVVTARLREPVRLPSRGEAMASLHARTDLVSSLQAVAQLARRLEGRPGGPPALRYSVSGTATLEGGRTIPFARSGDLAL